VGFPTTAVERTISAHGSTHGVAREFPHHWHCVVHNSNVTVVWRAVECSVAHLTLLVTIGRCLRVGLGAHFGSLLPACFG
jgi:hypothetical protein